MGAAALGGLTAILAVVLVGLVLRALWRGARWAWWALYDWYVQRRGPHFWVASYGNDGPEHTGSKRDPLATMNEALRRLAASGWKTGQPVITSLDNSFIPGDIFDGDTEEEVENPTCLAQSPAEREPPG